MLAALFKRYRALGGIAFVCVLLAACATPQRVVDVGSGPAFERTGRFALSATYNNGDRDAVQGGFAWHDTGRRLTLDLANPLGSTLARVQVVAGRALLTRSDGSTEQATDPDALVDLVLGSPIPVAGLRYWLQGRTGDAPVLKEQKDSEGHISHFEQNGWQIVLSRYDTLGPRLLQLNRKEADRSISVRLILDSQ